MRRTFISATLLAAALVVAARFSGASDAPVRPVVSVAPFHGDKPAAVSFTFDDGIQSHVDTALPLLSEHNYHASFYVIPGLTREHKTDPRPPLPFHYGEADISWDEVRQLAAAGNEIGNHSFSHTSMTRLPSNTALQHQIADADQLFVSHLGSRPATFACPYNDYNSRVKSAVLAHHVALRENWTDWGGPTFTAEQANQLLANAIAHHQWLVPMIHGIDGGFLPLDSHVFNANLDYLRAHDDEVWVDTYAAIAKYRAERAAAHVDVQLHGPNTATVTLDDGLDDATYDQPLTLILQPGEDDLAEVTATQDGHDLPVHLDGPRALIDTPPTGHPIQLAWR